MLLAFGCNGRQDPIPESLRERAIEQCGAAVTRALALDEGVRLSGPMLVRDRGAGAYSVRARLEEAHEWQYVECWLTEQEGHLEIAHVSVAEW